MDGAPTMSSLVDENRTLLAQVQRNCQIADSRHAQDYTLCTYLLKMREHYRWAHDLGYDHVLCGSDVSDWVDVQEQQWDELEGRDFTPLEFDGETVDAFDTNRVNEIVNDRGFVYSAGLGRLSRPMFFYGELTGTEKLEGYRVLISGKEWARCMTAPPAMAHGDTIFIRRDALRRMLWETIEDWRWAKRENALARAIRFYDFDRDADAALECMTDHEIEAVILHEIGEIVAGQMLGSEWHAMLGDIGGPNTEFMVRAVRDHLADCMSSLPALLSNADTPSLHFYFANLTAMRKDLFPALNAAYQHWVDRDDLSRLKTVVRSGKNHWMTVADRILQCHRRHGNQCQQPIQNLLNASRL